MNEEEIFKAVIISAQDKLGYIKSNVQRYHEVDYPQRLHTLQGLIQEIVLRAAGDYREFIRLTEAMNALPERQPSGQQLKTLQIVKWMRDEMNITVAFDQSFGPIIIINLLAFEKKYTKAVIDNLIPSWKTNGNLDALNKKFRVIVNIFTTASSHQSLAMSGVLIGLDARITYIPKDIVDGLDNENIYMLLGAVTSISLALAKKNNAALHFAAPDTIYSSNYFSNLVRLSETHNNILMPCHCADAMAITPALETYRKNGVINIPVADLCSIGINSRLIYDYPSFVNNRPQTDCLPMSHKLWWETEDKLIMHTPHMNAAYLSATTLQNIDDRFFHTIDSEIATICKGDDFYLPQAEDDMYLLEINEQSSRNTSDGYLAFSEYPRYQWQVLGLHDSLKFFRKSMSVKINRDLRPATRIIPEADVRREMQALYGLMLASDPYKGAGLTRLHD